MSIIDKCVLDSVNQYKMFLEQNIYNLINYVNINFPSANLFLSAEYKLFSIIFENVRMDLNYLLTLNPDFDVLGFPGLKRNIRVSIEAYYDLYNLVCDDYYFDLLKWKSTKNYNINEDILNHYAPDPNDHIRNNKYLTIKDKARIAKKNNLNSAVFEQFKGIVMDANSYVHPNIFLPETVDKEKILKELVFCDCQLLMYSFELLNNFICKKTSYYSQINPYNENNNLFNAIANIRWIY